MAERPRPLQSPDIDKAESTKAAVEWSNMIRVSTSGAMSIQHFNQEEYPYPLGANMEGYSYAKQ
jgi:hypothetical protein